MAGERAAGWREVFAVGEFRALWAAELQSVAGDQLARVAVSILVFDRTGSAALTAATWAISLLPDLVAGPLLSGLADRFPRRQTMLVADLARAVLVALMLIPGLAVGALAALLVAVQLFAAPFSAAQAATLPLALPGSQYVTGQAARQLTNQIAQFAGLAVGGGIVNAIGTSGALAVDAGSFVLSAALVRFGVAPRPTPVTDHAETGGHLSRMVAGARVIFTDPALRSLVGLAWLAGFVVIPEGLAVPYAAEIDAGPVAIGIMLAAHPAGLAVGAFAVHWLPLSRHRPLLGPLAVGAMLPLLAFAAHPPVSVAVLLLAASGMCGAYQIIASTTFMRAIPDAQRGQAFGLAGSGLIAVQGIGVLAGGLLAQLLGSPAAAITLAAAAGTIVGTVIAIRWHRQRRRIVSDI